MLTAAIYLVSMQAHEASKALFAQYRALGNAQINKHLLQIMALLLPMRRVCSGGCCAGQCGCVWWVGL